MQTGKTLPIYVYDSKGGELTEYNPPKEERESIVTRLKESRRLHSSSLGYWLETEEKGHYESYFDLLAKAERSQADPALWLRKQKGLSR